MTTAPPIPLPPVETPATWRDLRDARVLNRIAPELRQLDRTARHDRLLALARVDFGSALELARRSLAGRAAWADFAAATFPMVTPSVTTAGAWLATVRPALGWRRLLAMLDAVADVDPQRVEWVLYFAGDRAREDAEARAGVARLADRLRAGGPTPADG